MTTIGPGGNGMNLENIRTCARCGLRYDWRTSSTSTLKMTYCGLMCERADLGFTLDALLAYEVPKREEAEAPAPGA
ncbi:MAG: hypothetical protein Kow0010_12180 [Dehalococcoidia bacterium]